MVACVLLASGVLYATDVSAQIKLRRSAPSQAEEADEPASITYVRPSGVIGTRDAHRGETVKAVVVFKPAARGKVQPEDISAWARERMAAFKYPRVVEFVEQLPTTGTGKILRRKLQEEENRKCVTG